MKKATVLWFMTIFSAMVYYSLTFISPVVHTIPRGTFKSHIDQLELSGKDKPLRKIGLWNDFFEVSNWSHIMGNEREKMVDCDVPCLVSTDRTNPLQYDAVIFHGRNAQNPPQNRTSNQVYIMHLMESPPHRGEHFLMGGNFYNWTMTYNKRSDIRTPYFYFDKKSTEATKGELDIDLPQLHHIKSPAEALLLWMVSHCQSYGQRRIYIGMLQKRMDVDIYGNCGMNCTDNCFRSLAETGRYKFYLAFENSACEEYITEKIYNPMTFGLIPVVYGALNAQEYKDMLPPHSYIDVRNFESPEQLADYLQYLDGNDTAYLEYFNWRYKYTLRSYEDAFGKGLCQVCKMLNDASMKTPRNVKFEQFWSAENMCDSQMHCKVLPKLCYDSPDKINDEMLGDYGFE